MPARQAWSLSLDIEAWKDLKSGIFTHTEANYSPLVATEIFVRRDSAVKLVEDLAGESPAIAKIPVRTVVISGDGKGADHSIRKARTGSIEAARRAGMMPEMAAASTSTPMAMVMTGTFTLVTS